MTRQRPAQWASGNEYNGEWAKGKMTGRGTFVWASGERYDGDWREGKENGQGAAVVKGLPRSPPPASKWPPPPSAACRHVHLAGRVVL